MPEIDASHLARRVAAAVADRPEPVRKSAETVREAPKASAPAPATAPASSGPQNMDAPSPRGQRVIEVGKGKTKLSQNRSRADREGVVAGLRTSGRPDEQGVAEEMAMAVEEG